MLSTAVAAWLVLGFATSGEPAAPSTTRPVTGPAAVEAPPHADATEPTPPTEAPPTEAPPAVTPPAATAPAPKAHVAAKKKAPVDRYAPWEKKFGGFAEVDLQLTTMDDAFATVVGGGVGFIALNRIIVGASGYGLVYHDRDYPTVEGDRGLLAAWGGPTIGVYAIRTKRVESSATWLLAGGRACLSFKPADALCDDSTGLFVSHVEIDVYVKFAKIVRLGFGLGYRFVGASAWRGPGDWDLAGGYGSIKLALGRF